jgi:hypothetical protein
MARNESGSMDAETHGIIEEKSFRQNGRRYAVAT